MTDNILSIALVFSILAGGTAAIGSELVGSQSRVPTATATAMVTLPMVVVTGRRQAPTVVAAASVAAARRSARNNGRPAAIERGPRGPFFHGPSPRRRSPILATP